MTNMWLTMLTFFIVLDVSIHMYHIEVKEMACEQGSEVKSFFYFIR